MSFKIFATANDTRPTTITTFADAATTTAAITNIATTSLSTICSPLKAQTNCKDLILH
jgi:hypothetical protein